MQNTFDPRNNSQIVAQQYKEMIGSRYIHFKGGIYLVTDIAVHSESATLMVIYKSANNPDLTWARPLHMFLSEVDKNKYPDVKQKYRFEKLVEGKH